MAQLERAFNGTPAGATRRHQCAVNIEQQDGWFHGR
jgi:hypothetical protein